MFLSPHGIEEQIGLEGKIIVHKDHDVVMLPDATLIFLSVSFFNMLTKMSQSKTNNELIR